MILAAAAATDGVAVGSNGVSPAALVMLEDFKSLEAVLQGQAGLEKEHGNGGGMLMISPQAALQLLEVVKRACGQAARDLLQNLQIALSALGQGGLEVHPLIESNFLQMAFQPPGKEYTQHKFGMLKRYHWCSIRGRSILGHHKSNPCACNAVWHHWIGLKGDAKC